MAGPWSALMAGLVGWPAPERRNSVDEQRKIRVAVVFGGRSSEHAISCASAAHVLPALDPERYEIVPVGIARDGRGLQGPGGASRLAIGRGGELPSVDALAPPGAEIAARPGGAAGCAAGGPSRGRPGGAARAARA